MTLDPNFYGRGGPTLAMAPLDSVSPPGGAPDADPSIATIKRLSADLAARRAKYDAFQAYYDGEHGMRFSSADYEQAFSKRFGKYAENFCGLVVDAVEERLDVEGFRFPSAAAETDPDAADPDAWRIWQDNQLDAGSQIAHTEALVKSVVYVLVGQFEAEWVGKRSPRITVEDPCETIVQFAPGSSERLVGMKRWDDPAEKKTYATLYFPGRIEKWQTITRRWGNQYGSGIVAEPERWEPRIVAGENWPLANKLGVVPLVPLFNRPRLHSEGRSEIADIIPIQDAINKLATDELVTSESASFGQKWATGIEIPKDPVTGKDIESYRTSIDRFISTAAPDAKFGQFQSAELKGHIEAIGQKIQAIASISRTPYHYFLQHGGQPPSGQSLRGSETGLVRKARRKQRHFGEGWEEVMRLAFAALGDARSDELANEAKWANPESLTEAEHVDALTKLRAGINIPLKQLWEDAGYSPTQRAAFETMLANEASWLPPAPEAGEGQAPVATDAAPAPPPLDLAALGAWLLEALSTIAKGMAPTVSVAPPQTTIAPGAVQVTVTPPPSPKPTTSRVTRDGAGRVTGLTQE